MHLWMSAGVALTWIDSSAAMSLNKHDRLPFALRSQSAGRTAPHSRSARCFLFPAWRLSSTTFPSTKIWARCEAGAGLAEAGETIACSSSSSSSCWASRRESAFRMVMAPPSGHRRLPSPVQRLTRWRWRDLVQRIPLHYFCMPLCDWWFWVKQITNKLTSLD